MNIGIVGSEGFIGKSLINRLYDNSDLDISRFGTQIIADKNYNQLDLTNKEKTIQQFSKIDMLIYLASSSIPSTSWLNPIEEINNHISPFVNLIHILGENTNLKNILYISSAGTIYGNTADLIDEESVKNPISPHGISKLTIEYYLEYFAKRYDFKYTILRVSNVYGPGQNTSKGLGIINTFLENIIYKKDIVIFGDGENIRNYIYIHDLVDIILKFITTKTFENQIYNSSSFDHYSINEIIVIIKNTIKLDFEINYEKSRTSDVKQILLSNKKLLNKFKEINFTSIESAIIETYKYLQDNANK